MIKIGTNILYNGKGFLDVRQGEADSLSDLKTWNLNIPPGFEVCVDGVWYVYSPNFSDDEVLGRFRKRIDIELGDSLDFSGVQDDIEELMDEVFPLTLTISGGGTTHELGSSITPSLSWTVKRKGVSVQPTNATVNNSSSGVASNYLSFTGSPITATTTYNVKVWYDRLTKTASSTYTFLLRKYYGTSAKPHLYNIGEDPDHPNTNDFLNLSGKAFATGWTMTASDFDCTGGKYPYYVIPADKYSESTFKMWIGGLRNTDFIVSTQDVTNSSGLTSSYKVIRLKNLQTGVLSIRFGD